jgi:MerR family transcriptional regulator, light-induced transcriptional regulator
METLHIGAVERETGVPRDVLRVWERRYRFPRPRRDKLGDRVYTRAQVEKLQLIRRLMDAGHRAGEVVGRSGPELRALLEESTAPAREHSGTIARLLELAAEGRSGALRASLERALQASSGLPAFLGEVLAPLNTAVGTAWAAGRLPVHMEHLYTEVVQVLLRETIAELPISGREPRVLLTTLPAEQHELGLLMLEALYLSAGVHTVLLGTQTPRDEIVEAVRFHAADAVALSFSSAFPRHRLQREVRELRQALPAGIELWMGGAAVKRLRGRIPGTRVGRSLPDALALPEAWRAARKAHAR